MPYANSKGADRPAHPRTLIGTFVVRCSGGMICLSIAWSRVPGDTFSGDVAHMIYAWSVWLGSTLSFCHSVRII